MECMKMEKVARTILSNGIKTNLPIIMVVQLTKLLTKITEL